VIRRPILMQSGSNYAESRKDVPFWGPHDGRPHLGGQIPQKPFQTGALSTVGRSIPFAISYVVVNLCLCLIR